MDEVWTIGNQEWPIMEARWQSARAGKPAQMRLILPKKDPKPNVGDTLEMANRGDMRFAGFVFSVEEGPTHREVLAYDQRRYLMYRDTILIEGKTADEIITMLAKDMGLQLGTLAATAIPLDLAIEDKKLLDIIEQALALTEERGGKEYVLWDDKGKLSLSLASDLESGILLREDSALTDYRTAESIDEDSYNVIKLAKINKKKGIRSVCVVEDASTAAQWGRLQYYERIDEKLSEAEILAQANSLLAQKNRIRRTLTLHSLGDSRCQAGFGIDWELDGQQDGGAITNALHIWKGPRYTMTLDVEAFSWSGS